MARRIGDRHKGNIPEQVQAAFQLILQRQASSHELEQFAGYVTSHGLANACHLLLNTNEFLYLD